MEGSHYYYLIIISSTINNNFITAAEQRNSEILTVVSRQLVSKSKGRDHKGSHAKQTPQQSQRESPFSYTQSQSLLPRALTGTLLAFQRGSERQCCAKEDIVCLTCQGSRSGVLHTVTQAKSRTNVAMPSAAPSPHSTPATPVRTVSVGS